MYALELQDERTVFIGFTASYITGIRIACGEQVHPIRKCIMSYLGLFDKIPAPVFRPQSFTEMCLTEFPETRPYADSMWAEFQAALPGDCYLIPGGSDCLLCLRRAGE